MGTSPHNVKSGKHRYMDITTLASILLTGRIVALGFMIWVIRRQIYLFQNYSAEGYASTARRILFILAIILFISNFNPALIDFLAVFADLERGGDRIIGPIGLTYTFSNMITSVASSVAMFALYQLARKILEESATKKK